MVEPGITLVDAAPNSKELMKRKFMAAGLQAPPSRKRLGKRPAITAGVRDPPRDGTGNLTPSNCKGRVNLAPNITFEKTGAASGIVHGDNGIGQYVCNKGSTYD